MESVLPAVADSISVIIFSPVVDDKASVVIMLEATIVLSMISV